MRVTFGPLIFTATTYDEDDILWLERLGGFESCGPQVMSKEGDALAFDDEGNLVAMMILDPRDRFAHEGRVTETLPDGTELVSTDIGALFTASGRT